MPRLTFPYHLDRLTVYHFLMGGDFISDGNGDDGFASILRSEDRALRWDATGDAIMTFDTGGSLVVNLNVMTLPQSIRLANYVLALLDVPKDDYIQRSAYVDGDDVGNLEWTYRGEIVRTNDPLVLVGPMVVQAWRTTNK